MNNDNEVREMLDTLTEQLGTESVLELVEVYAQHSAEQVTKIAEAFALKDLGAMSRVAHSLKSSSANMGAAALEGACFKLEKLSALDDQTSQLVNTITTLQKNAVTAMAAWKPKS